MNETSSTSDSMIRLEAVTKTFPGSTTPAVTSLDLDIPRGAIVTLVGPSGCGKTTTLKMINRIVEPTSGRIWVDGMDATTTPPPVLRRSIGYVIQQIGLFPHRTIGQNIATVPGLLGWDKARIADRVDELLDLVGLEPGMIDRFPSELSGGQNQRVGVARALAADPPVLLMDEPFGAVDPIVRSRLQEELLDLQARVHKTIVFVTHDIDEAIHLGDRICILNVGGVVEQYDTPQVILRDPANQFVEDFIGGERGLKRLGLLTVGDAELDQGPMVEEGATVDEARRLMAQYDTDWIGVLGPERTLLGWVDATDLDGSGQVDGRLAQPFHLTIDRQSSLRKALDSVVASRTSLAIVVDGDRFLGALDLDTIAEEIRE